MAWFKPPSYASQLNCQVVGKLGSDHFGVTDAETLAERAESLSRLFIEAPALRHCTVRELRKRRLQALDVLFRPGSGSVRKRSGNRTVRRRGPPPEACWLLPA